MSDHSNQAGQPEQTGPNGSRNASQWLRQQNVLLAIYVVVALTGFIVLAVLARSAPYLPLDLQVTRFVQAFQPAWFVGLMTVVSWPGYMPQALILTILLVGILFFAGQTWEAGMAAAAAAVDEILDFSIKIFIQRPRPPANLVHVTTILTTYSFPSGHVMFFTVFFGFLFFLAFHWQTSSWLRILILVILGSLVALVGLSRVYLGEHWFTDVLGAYLLGSLVWLAAIRFYRWGLPRYSRPHLPTGER